MIVILLLILAFVSLAGVITGLILIVVGLASEKNKIRNAGFIVLPICLIVLVATLAFGTRGAIRKFQHWSESNYIPENTQDYYVDECNREYLIDSLNINSPVVRIKSYLNDSNKIAFNDLFFTDCGNVEFKRYPIRYPYAVHILNEGGICSLSDERSLYENADVVESKDNLIIGITDLNYDRNYLLYRVDRSLGNNDSTDTSKVNFCIFSFETLQSYEFKTEREMNTKAAHINYQGEYGLMKVYDYTVQFN